MLTLEQRRTQETYFRFIFKKGSGHICLAKLIRSENDFTEHYFYVAGDGDFSGPLEFIDRWSNEADLYLAPFYLKEPKRTKSTIASAPCAYADLDECHPDKLLVKPTMVLQTSEGRYQALWCFEDEQDPSVAEDLSRRIAYYHADDGADKSGWDLTQLLRIPHTVNLKHRNLLGYDRTSIFTADNSPKTPEQLFDAYPAARGYEWTEIPMPEEHDLPDLEATIDKHKNRLTPQAARWMEIEPEDDWSRALWGLENALYEAGMNREEAFVVCEASACNKYKRDNKSPLLLWKDVCKCYANRDAEYAVLKPADRESILSDDEIADANKVKTVIDEYCDWAKSVGDAAFQYHPATAFVLLSSLLAGHVKLPTSFGTIKPNLWFMIMADTTLTRKTTAMDLGMDILTELSPDAIIATDGSVEGLLTGMSARPGRPSVFLKDEFTGLLDAMVKKDYMSGMAELFTKLYDGKYQKRMLKKETIEIRDPVFILFAGGIKTRILSLLNFEHVASGFLPRFLFVTAESDVTKLRPLGPPTEKSDGQRDLIKARFATIAGHYTRPVIVSIGGKEIPQAPEHKATMTPAAWDRYNKIEYDLLEIGTKAKDPDLLTPTYDRMAKSGLKVATLLAASRRLDEQIVIDEEDLIKAFSFIEGWRPFTEEVLDGIGRTAGERLLTRITNHIENNPGISRGELMRFFNLGARDTDLHFSTLEQRNVIIRQKVGRGEKLYTTRSL